MKAFKKILFLITILIILRLTLPLIDLYSYNLTKDYYLVGKCCNSYTLKKGFFGITLIEDMNRQSEWIINSNAIYGFNGKSKKYFYINQKTNEVTNFDNLHTFNNFLKSHQIDRFNMSKSENLVHLKFGNGRDRKFH